MLTRASILLTTALTSAVLFTNTTASALTFEYEGFFCEAAKKTPAGCPGNFANEDAAILANEATLGADIEKIGKVEGGGLSSWDPAEAKFDDVLVGFSYTTNDPLKPNEMTGFTFDFDFSALNQTWDVVKVIIKGGQYSGVWLITDPGPTDNGAFTHQDYRKLWEDVADTTSLASNDIKAISNIQFYGVASTTQVPVPEPGTLLLLGAGLLGVGLMRRISGKA